MEHINKITINDVTYPIKIDWEDIVNKPALFNGNYNDLTNKPILYITEFDSTTGVITIGEKRWQLAEYTKPKNTITFNLASSAVRGSLVTVSASALYGNVTIVARDNNNNPVEIVNGKFTITSKTTITVTSLSTELYDADTVTKAINCTEPVAPTVYGYKGYSLGEPNNVSESTSNRFSLPGVGSVLTTNGDGANCHWVAYPSGYSCTNAVDKDNDVIGSEKLHTKTIGSYTVYYYLEPEMFIENETKFTISKNS